MDIGIIILAAGASTRMGKSKQLLRLANDPLLLHAVKTATQTKATEVTVVLGANHEIFTDLIKDQPVSIVYNADWEKGIGTSIKVGLNYIQQKNNNIDAVIIMVCDQPLLTSQHLDNLMSKYEKSKSKIVASSYGDTAGTPALFDNSLFNELLSIEDQYGAKKIIDNHQYERVDFPNGIIDLDTPEEYTNFINQYLKK